MDSLRVIGGAKGTLVLVIVSRFLSALSGPGNGYDEEGKPPMIFSGRRRISAVFVAVGLSTLGTIPALADEGTPESGEDEPSILDEPLLITPLNAEQIYAKGSATPGFTGRWFVELEAKPTIKGGRVAAIDAQQDEFTSDVAQVDIDVENTFEDLWNGVVVTADEAELAEIVKADNVKAIFPVHIVERPTEPPEVTAEPSMDHARSLTGVESAYEELGLTGSGVKIGIIDSGIDIDHTAFGGTGVSDTTDFPNAKVVAGYDFVGDDYNAAYGMTPVPDAIPDDCMGHGTHVAGIAAGHDAVSGFRGVAPEATLGAYRVFGCEGTTDDEVILQAMERAFHDGMNVVNLSLGSPLAWSSDYPTSVAADNLAKAGITVVASQGNDGALGIFSGGVPANAREVIAVGSVFNATAEQYAFEVAGDLFGYHPVPGSFHPPLSGDLDVVAYPEGQKTGAVDLPGTPLNGKAVLVSRGDPTSYEQALAAQEDGAAALIIYNTQEGTFESHVFGDKWIDIPVVTIGHREGAELESIVANSSEPVRLRWTDELVDVPYFNAGIVVDSSSWGVTGDLDIKPDVLAPGGGIYSTYPLDSSLNDGSGFVTMSGTSMAAPHVSGAAALLLEANPSLDPPAIKTVLQNSAVPVKYAAEGTNPDEWLAPIDRQGGGLINMMRAVYGAQPSSPMGARVNPSTITPAKIDLLDGDDIETTPLTISNSSGNDVTYTLSVNDLTANSYGPNRYPLYAPPYDLRGVTSFSQTEVVVPSGQSRTVDVTIGEPLTHRETNQPVDQGAMYGGYIVVNGNDGSESSIPFFGVVGDYETDRGFVVATNRQVYGYRGALDLGMDPEALYGGPLLAVDCRSGNECIGPFEEVTSDDHSFEVVDGDFPVLGYHVESPILGMVLEAFHANEDGTKGAPVGQEPVLRLGATGVTPDLEYVAWDGTIPTTTSSGEFRHVESGRYVIELTAVKGIGSGITTESWLSRPFILKTGIEPPDGRTAVLDNGWDGDNLGRWELPDADDYVMGDWDGDGVDSLMWRVGNTYSYVNNSGDEPVSFHYGRDTDAVVAGDWDGDGKDTLAVRRGVVTYYKNKLAGGVADNYFYFGRPDDLPLVGDWDGDGKDTIALQRGTTFFVNNSLAGGNVNGYAFGAESDRTLAGDWDGDGRDSFALVRGETIVINNFLNDDMADTRPLRISGDRYIVGDWDGDGTDTLGTIHLTATT